MIITQPSENPNIPTELANKITGIRNQISIGEAEIIRHNELIRSLKYEVNELVKQKADYLEQNKTLEAIHQKLSAMNASLENEVDSLKQDKAKNEKEITERLEAFGKERESLLALRADIKKEDHELNTRVAHFENEKIIHENDKAAFNAKVDRLTKALR